MECSGLAARGGDNVISVSAAFQTAIAEETVKLAELYEIQLADGTVHRYTTHQQDIVWDAGSNTYSSVQPIQRQALGYRHTGEFDEVEVAFANIAGDLFDKVQLNVLENALLTIKRIRWDQSYASDEEYILFLGTINVRFNRKVLSFSCRPYIDSLNILVPRHLFQEPCNHILFDDGCSLSRTVFAYAGQATGGSRTTVVDSTRGTVYSVPFDGGDEDNPLAKGDVINQSVNDFSADANCVSPYNLEDGALGTDSKGTNTLTNVSITADTSLFKQGAASAFANGNTDQLWRADADLSADFPGKSGTANRTLSFTGWIRPTGVTGFQYIASKYSTVDSKRTFAVGMDNTALFFTIGYNGGVSFEQFTDTGTTIVAGQWYHVGVTYDGTSRAWRIRIWDDSASIVAETTGTGVETMNLEDTEFTLFARDDNTGAMDGHIDEAVIFKDILTADEIDEIRNQRFGVGVGVAGGLVVQVIYLTPTTGTLWYVEQSGPQFVDNEVLVSGGNSVTVNGTPAEDITYHQQGELQMTSGDNSGSRRPILSNSVNTITTMWPFVTAIVNGDTYNVYPGCDQTTDICLARFNNPDNFRGFPYIPRFEEAMT